MAVLRAGLRYGEQACNHFIAFKLLALIRDKVFGALRRLCPAKLEGRDKGDLISVITSDIELLEVFYAHTISPTAIAVLFSLILVLFIGHFHWILGLLALAAYLAVGVLVPLITSHLGGDDAMRFRAKSGDLSSFVLDSLRGLPEILQYGQGRKRLEEMNRRTEGLFADEERMKRNAGRNVAFLDAMDEEIVDACKKASVHDFIMTLPKGYDTPVGELGETLSGGERQRLGLARAFLHGAPFLLLDEPTSNLDSLNEAVILRALCEEGKDKTVVLVSHRASPFCFWQPFALAKAPNGFIAGSPAQSFIKITSKAMYREKG